MAGKQPAARRETDWAALADRIDALADDLARAAASAGEDDEEMINLWARGLKHYAIQLRQTFTE